MGLYDRNPAGMPEAGLTQLGYNVANPTGDRKKPESRTQTEDKHLPTAKRKVAVASTMDAPRNFSVIAWMVKRHLDFVADHHFFIKIKDAPETSQKLSRLMDKYDQAEHFDAAERVDRFTFFRLFERSCVIAGDCGFKFTNKFRVQGIESSMIGFAKPESKGSSDKKDYSGYEKTGIKTDGVGKITSVMVLKYAQCGAKLVFDSICQAKFFHFDGFFTRMSTCQIRGISPLTACINEAMTLYEGIDRTLLKIRLHAILGIAISRKDQTGPLNVVQTDNTESTDGEDDEEDYPENPKYDVSFPEDGLMMVDGSGDSRIDTIESKTPAPSVMEFFNFVVQIILQALNIPLSFWDSRKSSFSARAADWAQYELQCAEPRKRIQRALRKYSTWRINYWVKHNEAGLADLMAKESVDLETILDAATWLPVGTPWMNKADEVAGDAAAIAIGIDSAPRAARRRGLDTDKLLEEQSEFLAKAESLSVPISHGLPGGATVEAIKDELETQDQNNASDD